MSIPFAFCVEYGDLLDIEQAHDFYFARPEPRRELEFLCPNEGCRHLDPPAPIAGVNYAKVPGIDRILRQPHYRVLSGYRHSEDCKWVELKDAIDELDHDPATRRLAHIKKSELVDVFDPAADDAEAQRTLCAEVASIGLLPTKRERIEAYKRYLREHPNRTSRLGQAVRCFEALTPDERETTPFRIGELERRTYRKYFAVARFCTPNAYYQRIYYGRANVFRWRTGYSIRFAETARQADNADCTVSVFVADAAIEVFVGRGALLATLEAAREQRGNVVTCYVFGQIQRTDGADGVPHVDIRIQSLHSLAVTLTEEA